MQKFVRMTSDFKKLFTAPGKNYIVPYDPGMLLTILSMMNHFVDKFWAMVPSSEFEESIICIPT